MRLEPRIGLRVNAVLLLVVSLAACDATMQYAPIPQNGVAREPIVAIDPSTGIATTEISVLIYNVAGLPWPISRNKRSRSLDDQGERIPISSDRSTALKEIGDRLGAMRMRGDAPDIILLQEAFIAESAEMAIRGGYPNWVAGPSSAELGEKFSDAAPAEFIEARSFWKGEKLGKHQSSGILVASNFPIIKHENYPFNQWECAGFDCLANKGVILIHVRIPGLPDPVQITTTHFNSRGASGVSAERSRIAHALQVNAASGFLESAVDYDLPEIWGGDLNMRHADDRLSYFVERAGGEIDEVSSYCLQRENACDVRIDWQTDAPWYETQDLQGWFSGSRVEVEPVRVEALFHEPVEGIMQSDHDGLLVHYRLSWSVAAGKDED